MHFRHYSLRVEISFRSLFDAHWNLFWSKSSMELSPEFHWTFWTTFEQHLLVHEIPWNLSNKTSSSMEFHWILSRSKVPWNSMELFQYSRVLWNSMEFHGTSNFQKTSSMEFHGTFLSSLEFHGTPWNLINLIFKNKHISKYCCWYFIDDYMLFGWNLTERYILHGFQYRNSYFEHPNASENDRSAKMAGLYI